jgi:hypothetical protein
LPSLALTSPKNKLLLLLLLLPIILSKARTDPNPILEMPHAIIVVKRDILFEIVMFVTRIIRRTIKDTNPEEEVITIPLGIIDPMTDPDPEIEANPEIEITTALDIIDPGAEVNPMIDTEVAETITLLIDLDLEIDHPHLTLVMSILLILLMITLMNNSKPFWLMKLLELPLPII